MDGRCVVVIADEQPIVRWALRAFLAGQPDIELAGEASSCAGLGQLVRRYRPHVAVTDLQFQDGSVISSLPSLSAECRVLAFSANDSWEHAEEFTSAGGMGFVSKLSQLPDLVAAIKAVARNKTWIAPSVRSALTSTASRPADAGRTGLTLREREVVALVARGRTSKQIAEQLCVSLNTVETHRYRVFKKLNITRIAQLADYAIKNGIVGVCVIYCAALAHTLH